MPVARDIPSSELLEELKKEMKGLGEVSPPSWAQFVKTGSHRQGPPQQEDWWYMRAASILRNLYLRGPVGVERLRTKYGGRKDRGVRPEHFRKASGHIIRKILQQLEKAGLVERVDGKGRKITPKGQSLLDSLALRVLNEKQRIPGEVKFQ